MSSHRKRKTGPSRKHAVEFSEEEDGEYGENLYPTLPRFEFDETFDYGHWTAPPRNRHFVPRYSKLKKAGGKSISFYEKWRQMQYEMNCVMKRFLEHAEVNLSVLPPCADYTLWRRPSWRQAYDRPLDEDPCPDCDVRFRWERSEWIDKIAPASILHKSRRPKNKFQDSVIMIGLPQHIAIGYLRQSEDMAIFEFFDPAGPTGDRDGVRELRKWCEHKLPKQIRRNVEFHQVHRKVNFQHDLDDVMCQTWIWYWVYFRVIRKMPPREIANFVKTLVQQERSLNHIHKFNCWLSDLYRVGFLCRETQSQTDVARNDTPRDPRGERTSSASQSTRGHSSGGRERARSSTKSTHSRSQSRARTSLSRNSESREPTRTTNTSLVRKQKTKKSTPRTSNASRDVAESSSCVRKSSDRRVQLSRTVSPGPSTLVRKDTLRKSTRRGQ